MQDLARVDQLVDSIRKAVANRTVDIVCLVQVAIVANAAVTSLKEIEDGHLRSSLLVEGRVCMGDRASALVAPRREN